MNQVALLEYDEVQEAVINPAHEKLNIKLPKTAVFAFVGEVIDEYAKQFNAPVVAEFISITKKYPIYVVNYKGREICLCQAPCGAAPATQIMDWLIGYGVETIISTGCCGVLLDIPENEFLIVNRALREEGTSFHYLPPSRYIDLNPEMVKTLQDYFDAHEIPYETCTTWTTDGFYRETKKKVLARKEEGCSVVEMECSALAACAQFRNVKFGQFLFTADSLNSLDNYDEREWGVDSLRPALMLALDIAANMEV